MAKDAGEPENGGPDEEEKADGTALDNLPVGISVGIAIGIAIGAAMSRH